ncbi:MAG TPA: ATP-binding protein, partial [Nitriliruptorales bacterium]|nr:ATP-binding protein [Nitriliruptorales bacterium]
AVRPDGSRRWLRWTITPLEAHGEAAAGVVLVCRDVTRSRETEQLKDDFLATVSHELRTPLTPLRGFLATALARWRQLTTEQVEEMLHAMERQVARMESLVADLLTIADLGRGDVQVRTEPVALLPLAQGAAERTRADAGERVQLGIGQDVQAVTDARAVTRIVDALVSNAIKHTDGEVIVDVRTAADEVIVEVHDRGEGIPPWEQDVIFGRFGRRGDVLTRPTQGPGLGLAIARSLAERVGGRLQLRSELGRGSTFALHLPRATEPAVVAPVALASTARQEAATVNG